MTDSKKHKGSHIEQSAYIEKNIELILEDIRKNGSRLCSDGSISELHDYGHEAEFLFGNWVRPDENSRAILYRISVSTTKLDSEE